MKAIRRFIFRWLFSDVGAFINGLYAMERDPSYFIKLPTKPDYIRDLT